MTRKRSRLTDRIRRRQHQDQRDQRRRKLRIETCEPRMMLAGDVIEVTDGFLDDTIDAGDGKTSLREAIIQANANPGSIINLPAGEFALNSSGGGNDTDQIGDLDISTGVTILGDPKGGTVIDAGNLDAGSDSRVFHIFSPGPATLTATLPLTINEGVAATETTTFNSLDSAKRGYQAGDRIEITGVNNDGTTFTDSLSVGTSTEIGDLIDLVNTRFNDATMTIDGDGYLVLTPDNNGASDFPIVLTITGDDGNSGKVILPEFDAGDESSPNVTISNVTITGGSAVQGAGIYNRNGLLTLRDVLLEDNSAGDAGGAIFNVGGIVSVEDSEIRSNDAGNQSPAFHNVGGLVTLINTPLVDNTIGSTNDDTLLTDIEQLILSTRDDLVDGVNGVLGGLESTLRERFASVEVPGIGQRLNEYFEPFYADLNQVRGSLAGFFDELLTVDLPETAPSLQELLQYGMYVILGPGIAPPADVVDRANDVYFDDFPEDVKESLRPLTQQLLTIGGLDILQDGIDTDGVVSPTDILVTLGDDEYGTRWIEFGFHLGGQSTFDTAGGFDLGIHRFTEFANAGNADRYQGGGTNGAPGPVEIDDTAYANFLKDFGFGTALQSTGGLRADAKWDARLGFGLSERLGKSGSLANGFYINGAQTKSGRADDTPIEEVRFTLDVFAAPDNQAVRFEDLFEDTVTTPNLKSTVTFGVFEATVSDGTPSEVKITAPNGIPFDLNGRLFGETEFFLDITRGTEGTTTKKINVNAPQNALGAPALLAALNGQLFGDFGSILPPVAFQVDFSPIDTFYNPGAPNTPFLVLVARDPDISNLVIRPTGDSDGASAKKKNASNFGFLETQFEDRRALGVGFGNNSFSVLDQASGKHVLAADVPAPSSGVLLQDPEFRIWVGGQRVGDVTEGATPIRIYWQEILNRTISQLDSVGDISVSLEDRLQQEIDDELSAKGLTNNGVIIDVDVVTGPDGEKYFELRSDELLTVTYQVVDQSKISLVAAVDITSADYQKDASFLRDFPKDQRNFNRLTVSEITGTAKEDLTSIFDPTIKAETQLRLHVRTGGSEVLAEQMTTAGTTNTPFGIPEISFDFKLDAAVNFDAAIDAAFGDEDLKVFGDFFSIDTLQFANLTLDVRDLLEATVVPVAESALKLVEPVLNVVGGAASGVDSILSTRIPVISDLVGKKITLEDAFDIPTDGAGDTAVDRFIDRINEIKNFTTTIDLNGFGDFNFGDFDIVLDPKSIFYFPKRKVPVPSGLAAMEEQIKGLGAENFMRSYAVLDQFQPLGFSFDLIRPQTLFDMVTGQPFNIVSFGLPTIDFDAGFEGSFGFEGFDIGLAAYAAFDSELRLVYDSRGLEDIVASVRAGSPVDWTDLVNGLALQNNPGGFELGGSVNIFTWDGTRDSSGAPTSGPVGITTDVVELTAEVDVGASLGLEVYDPNNDGKLRLDEINEITDNFQNPENLFCIFDVTGDAHFTAKGTAKFLGEGDSLSLDVGVESFSLQDMLTSLFGTCNVPVPDPILAEDVYVDGERVLRINTGPYAASRLYGDVSDSEDTVKRVEEDADGRFVTVIETDGSSTRYNLPVGNSDKYRPAKREDLPQAGKDLGLEVDFVSDTQIEFLEVEVLNEGTVNETTTKTLLGRFEDGDGDGRFFRTDVQDDTFLTIENEAPLRWSNAVGQDTYLKKSSGTYKQLLEGAFFDDAVTKFNSDGNVQSITDWLGAKTIYSYDTSTGRLREVSEESKNGKELASYPYFHGVSNSGADPGIRVTGTDNSIVVSGFGVTGQTYTGSFDRVIAVGDSLDDSFDFSGLSGVPVDLKGMGGADELVGGDDDDEIDGGAGDDDINGRQGDDTITAGRGVNIVVDFSDDGNDYFDLTGNEAGITLDLLGGNDTVIGSAFDDTIDAGTSSGDVTIYGLGGNDDITGGSGNDSLAGGDGDDTIAGGAASDVISGGFGEDNLMGDAGDDTIDGGFDDDQIYSHDDVSGGDGLDVLFGSLGDDELTVGLNTVAAIGSIGDDSVHFLMDAGHHAATLTDAAYEVTGSTYDDTIYLEVESLKVTLGDASSGDAYELTIDGPKLPLTQVQGGTGRDEVTVRSLPALAGETTTILLGGGADKLTVLESQRQLMLDGEGASSDNDTLEIDRYTDPSSRFGKMTQLGVTGLGMESIAYQGFELIEVILGTGDDSFTVESTDPNAIEVKIQGNLGDDTLAVEEVNGRLIVNGNYGTSVDGNPRAGRPNDALGSTDLDRVELVIPGVPAGIGLYTDLTANVERLRIDNSANDTTDIAWSYDASGGGAKIYAKTASDTARYEVVDTLGADWTIFTGGQGTSDDLTIEDTVDTLQRVSVDGEHVQIREGVDVLEFTDSGLIQAAPSTETIDALGGIVDIVTSPDGDYLYVLGSDDNAITVLRRTASGPPEFVQVVRDGSLGVSGLSGATGIDVSNDGTSLYVISQGSIAHFSRVAETGRLVYRGSVTIAVGGSIATHASGNFVFATGSNTLNVFSRDTVTGALTATTQNVVLADTTAGNLIPTKMISSDDGDYVFVLGSTLFDGIQLWMYKVSSSGSLTLEDKITGTFVDFAIASDGSELYTVSRGLVNQYSVSSSGLSKPDSVSVLGNPYAKAIALDPSGASDTDLPRVITSFDVNTPVPADVVKWDIQQITTTGIAEDTSKWKLYIQVDGSGYNDEKVWGAKEFSTDGETKNVNFNFEVTNETTLTLWESGNDCGRPSNNCEQPFADDKIGTISVDPSDDFATLLADIDFTSPSIAFEGSVELASVITKTKSLAPASGAIQLYGFLGNQFDLSPTNVSADGQTPFFDSLHTNPSYSNVYALESLGDEFQVFDGDGDSLSHTRTVANGDPLDSQFFELKDPSFTNAIFSRDESHVYAINSRYGTLTVHDWDDATGDVGALEQTILAGLPAGSDLVADVRTDPNLTSNDRIYVSHPTEDSIYVFSRDSASDLLEMEAVFTDGLNGVDGLDGVTDLQLSQNGKYLYAAGTEDDAIAIFKVNSSGNLSFEAVKRYQDLDAPVSLTVTGTGKSSLYASSAGNDSLLHFELATPTFLNHLETYTDNANGIDGLAGPKRVVANSIGDGVYVAGSDDSAIAVFQRDDSDGQLTFIQAIGNGKGGVTGIDGVMELATTTLDSGEEVVVAAGATDSLAVFLRESDGRLTLLQRLTDGTVSGGVKEIDGLEGVTSMVLSTSSSTDYLLVGSGGKTNGDGALAAFSLSTVLGDPQSYDVDYSDIEFLKLRTQDQGDVVTVGEVLIDLTIETQGGSDAVTLRDTPENEVTVVRLGDGNDSLDLYRSGDNGSTIINGDKGDDRISVFATGSGAATLLQGQAGADTFEVKGARLESDVSINGHDPTSIPGDVLIFDAQGGNVDRVDQSTGTGDSLTGTIQITGESFGAVYTNIEEVVELAGPEADAGGPYLVNDAGATMTEGDDVELDGSQSYSSSAATSTTYDWTVGTSTFTTVSPLITWSDLQAAGLGDDGTYTLALKVTSVVAGQTLTDIATAKLIIANKAPTLLATGNSKVEAGTTFVLDLSATDPGDDQVNLWEVNWRDGSPVTIQPGAATTATHTFTTTGDYKVRIEATDEDGGPYVSTFDVEVTASRYISGAAFIDEGDSFTLALNNPSKNDIDKWIVSWGDGTTGDVVPSDGTATLVEVDHDYADSGAYRITVETVDTDGSRRSNLSPLDLLVRNLAPTVEGISIRGVDATQGVTVFQGANSQISVTASDPVQADILRYEFDFDGNGTFEYASDTRRFRYVFTEVGTIDGMVRAIDDDGGVSDPVPFEVEVKNVAPEVTLGLGSDDPREGIPTRFDALAFDPGGEVLSYQWDFDGNEGYEVNTQSSPTAFYTFPDDGTYDVSVLVTDANGGSSSASLTVDVRNLDPIFTRPTTYFRLVSLKAIDVLDEASDEPLIWINDETVFEADVNSVRKFEPQPEPGEPDNSVDLGGFYSRLLTEELQVQIGEGSDVLVSESGPRLTIPIDTQPGVYNATFTLDQVERSGEYELIYEVVTGQTLQTGVAIEGTPTNLSAAAFDYAGDYDPLTFDFDLDGDGVYDEFGTDGKTSVTFPDDGSYRVGVRVSDGDGGVTESSTWVRVDNAVPTVQIQAPESVREGVEFSITLGEVIDPGDDTVTKYVVHWGDGLFDAYTAEEITSLGSELTHTYENVLFERTISVVVLDEDGTHKAGEQAVFVQGAGLIDGTLFVVGFNEDDCVTINQMGHGDDDDDDDDRKKKSKKPGDFKVHASFLHDPSSKKNSKHDDDDDDDDDERCEHDDDDDDDDRKSKSFQVFDGESVERIVVFTYGGDDHVTIAGSIDIPVVIHGGSGDDRLKGGKGPTVLVGAAGKDDLTTGNARDILIGGDGRDDLNAKKGDDVLVADETVYDDESAGWEVLFAMQNEWNSSRSYDDRVDHLRQGTGEYLAQSGSKLDVTQDTGTVVADHDKDTLKGSKGNDWFLAEAGDKIKDAKTKSGELIDRSIAPSMVDHDGGASSLDVNQDGQVSSLDVLSIINLLQSFRSGGEGEQINAGSTAIDADVNGDGTVSVADALTIINRLGRQDQPESALPLKLSEVDSSGDEEDDLLDLLAGDVAGIWS